MAETFHGSATVDARWPFRAAAPQALRQPAGRRAQECVIASGAVNRGGRWSGVLGRVVVPLVFRPGPAEVAFSVALAVWLVFEFVMRVRQHLQSKGPASVDRSAFILVPCLAACVVLAEMLGRRGGLPGPGPGLAVRGRDLIGAGIALRAWSIATLGRFFQYWIKIQPGHRVVTGGPYRYVRHPSYTGIALVLTGLALACDDVWSLVAVVIVGGIGLAVRIRTEERQLTQALGAEYEQFAAGRQAARARGVLTGGRAGGPRERLTLEAAKQQFAHAPVHPAPSRAWTTRGANGQGPRPRPPSTTTRWPVMKPASSDAKKLTAQAMSSGVPIWLAAWRRGRRS